MSSARSARSARGTRSQRTSARCSAPIGKAHVATNIPIFTHTGIPGKSALEQLDILEDAGVKPDAVVIGHLGNLVDANVYVHKAICRRGAFVGFDRQGGNDDAQQVPMVMALHRSRLCRPPDVLGRRLERLREDLDGVPAEAEGRRRERRGAAPHHGRQSAPVSRVRSEAAAEALTGSARANERPTSLSACENAPRRRRRRPSRPG